MYWPQNFQKVIYVSWWRTLSFRHIFKTWFFWIWWPCLISTRGLEWFSTDSRPSNRPSLTQKSWKMNQDSGTRCKNYWFPRKVISALFKQLGVFDRVIHGNMVITRTNWFNNSCYGITYLVTVKKHYKGTKYYCNTIHCKQTILQTDNFSTNNMYQCIK